MTIARRISIDELTRTLPPLAALQVRNDVLEACAETAEAGGKLPKGVEFWHDDGELLALGQADELEAGIDHGNGALLAEFEVGGVFYRCITCGESNTQPSSWCSQRCRNLLRAEGRRLLPGCPDGMALDEAEKWAASRRNGTVGWFGPLTAKIAEALYWRD